MRLRADAGRLDDRPPFRDLGLLERGQPFRRLLRARGDVEAEIGEALLQRWIGERFVWIYVGTLWLGGLKVWLGTLRPIAEVRDETITLRPLHQFRSRTVRWSDISGTEQMIGGDRMIVYFDTPRGMRFVALNLNLVKGRREFLKLIDERLLAMGFVEKSVERSRYLSRA